MGPFVGLEEKRRIETLEARAAALEAGPLALAAVNGAETANVIRTTITCTDGAGDAVAAAWVLVELLTAGLVPVDMASQAFDPVTGTALSADLTGSNIAMLSRPAPARSRSTSPTRTAFSPATSG